MAIKNHIFCEDCDIEDDTTLEPTVNLPEPIKNTLNYSQNDINFNIQ